MNCPSPIERLVKQQYGMDTLRSLVTFAIERMRETQLKEVASSMTLTTLMALVPLIAVSLAAFALFPGFEDARQGLERLIFQSFLPDQYSEVIVSYIRNFSNKASGLGIFGLVGLVVTALLLIDKFFVTVNRIFRVRRMRSWSQRALLYWALITVAPALIAFSLSVATQAVQTASDGIDPGAFEWIMLLLQIVLQAMAYTFLFKFVPNCHVPVSHAATGGIFVAFSGVLVREGFQQYVTAGTLGTIYGAFVALPVLLLWFYVSWILIFAGAAITATIPLLTSGRFADNYKSGNAFLTGLALLRVLDYERKNGNPSVSIGYLSDAVDSDTQTVHRILDKLSEKGYCSEMRTKNPSAGSEWALLCDSDKTTLRGAVDTLLIDPSNKLVSPKRIGKRTDEGMLFDWYRKMIVEKSVDTPLSEVFSEPPKNLPEILEE